MSAEATDDRIVVIAGATGQLGRAVAAALADDGHCVVVLGRDQSKLDSVIAGLGGRGGHAGVKVDPTDGSALLAAAQRVRDAVGAPSIVIDAIGGYRGGSGIAEAAEDELEAMLDAHVRSAWNLARAFLADIRIAQGGRFVTFSTTTAQTPGATGAAYAASKAALEALTLAAAKELAKADATANVVALRLIDAEKRTGTSTREIVATVRWLISPEAAAVNGQRIPLVGRA